MSTQLEKHFPLEQSPVAIVEMAGPYQYIRFTFTELKEADRRFLVRAGYMPVPKDRPGQVVELILNKSEFVLNQTEDEITFALPLLKLAPSEGTNRWQILRTDETSYLVYQTNSLAAIQAEAIPFTEEAY